MAGLADADSREQLEFQNAKKGGSTPPHYMHECENKGVAKWAIRKYMKRKGRQSVGQRRWVT